MSGHFEAAAVSRFPTLISLPRVVLLLQPDLCCQEESLSSRLLISVRILSYGSATADSLALLPVLVLVLQAGDMPLSTAEVLQVT